MVPHPHTEWGGGAAGRRRAGQPVCVTRQPSGAGGPCGPARPGWGRAEGGRGRSVPGRAGPREVQVCGSPDGRTVQESQHGLGRISPVAVTVTDPARRGGTRVRVLRRGEGAIRVRAAGPGRSVRVMMIRPSPDGSDGRRGRARPRDPPPHAACAGAAGPETPCTPAVFRVGESPSREKGRGVKPPPEPAAAATDEPTAARCDRDQGLGSGLGSDRDSDRTGTRIGPGLAGLGSPESTPPGRLGPRGPRWPDNLRSQAALAEWGGRTGRARPTRVGTG